ncbi:type VII secretion integral membrane protein EccD [Nocardia paucivorans]|uniref:type VII secretion integral membrane protein EccD n=1 Tax=Nocardia paucivorans TaxID=114259 RepID=UPI00030F9E84|nr:type VII secretion integral membrane protein EccD [Nocardia paucivorans]
MSESSTSATGAVGPELCRVSVIGGNTQVDLGLPSAVPIAGFISDVVDLIESRTPDLTEREDAAPPRTTHWTLARIGHDPIPPNQTLSEAEVFDGELLVLRSVASKESPALFDDVIDAVSRLTADAFRSWSPAAARWMGLLTALGAVLAAIGLLAAAKQGGASSLLGFITFGSGIAALTAAVIAVRKYAATLTAVMLSLYTILLCASAAALFVPGKPGSPHMMLACATALVIAVVAYSLTGVGALVCATVVVTVLLGGCAAFVRMVWDIDTPKLAAGVLVAALVVITMAPRIAVAAARLPIPPVPTAGGAIDPADHEPRPTIEDIGAIGATALPSAAGLEQRAKAANHYQSGLLLGCVISAAIGAVLAADPLGAARWQGIALAVVVGLILCLRGRSFADLVQAAVLIGGGATTLVAVLVAVAVGQPSYHVPIAAVLLGICVAMLVFGVIAPHLEMSPVMRRTGEIIEYLLIVTVIPLVLWIMDLYSAARNL